MSDPEGAATRSGEGFHSIEVNSLHRTQSHLVIGQVVLMHAAEGLVRDFRIDPQEYGPLGRLSGKTYSRLGELIRV